MDIKTFEVAIASYLENNIIPAIIPGGGNKWIIGGLLAVATPVLNKKISTSIDTIKGMGLVDEKGNVNIAMIDDFLTGAFDAQCEVVLNPKSFIPTKFNIPFLDYLDVDLKFNREDAQKFIEFLQAHN